MRWSCCKPTADNHPDLPNVPQAIKFAKGEEGRKMIEVGIHGDSDIVRTYTLPPGTPKDRVQLLRRAFDATLKDPEFVADAKKSRLNVDPIPAEEIEKDISGLFKLDPALGRQAQRCSLQLTPPLILSDEHRPCSLEGLDRHGHVTCFSFRFSPVLQFVDV